MAETDHPRLRSACAAIVMMRSVNLQSELDPCFPPASCPEDDLSASTAGHRHALFPSVADALIVEVDRGSASSWAQRTDRAFMVRLRRRDASVIVTVGLSQVAAVHLADHIADVVGASATAVGEP